MDTRGVTLIELILYIALIGAIAGILTTTLFGLTDGYQRERQAQLVERQGRIAMQEMVQAVRNANAVSNISPGDSAPSLELDTDSGTHTYKVSGETLQLDDGSTVALTNDRVRVTAHSFRNLSVSGDHDTIRIRFTLTAPDRADTSGEAYEKEFISSAHVRGGYE